jgi:2,3-bisphosphoglycerate-independent phosphoglycerate mutase
MELDLIRQLSIPADSKVVLCVMDGLGGMPGPRGRTELQEASTRHLDRLAGEGSLGRTIPVGYGITPGSGPGHLALFGYDPLVYNIGRGALEATGIDFDLQPNDLAARGNFCDLDADGLVTDRRAGRLPTEVTAELCEQLQSSIDLAGVETFVLPVRDQRFVLVLRGEGLSDQVSDSDPQVEGVSPLVTEALDGDAEPTAVLIRTFVEEATGLLAGRERGNGVLLRGWSMRPNLPPFPELWKLRAAAVTVYPMYRGVARLAGMTAVDAGDTLKTQFEAVRRHWDEFDFFFVHYKYTDTAGEDGDFLRKQQEIANFDRELPALLDLEPDVIVVTGDHSTPAMMAAHSWHPVPTLIWGRDVRPDHVHYFSEPECARGELGTFPAKELIPLAFAHASRLAKYGA